MSLIYKIIDYLSKTYNSLIFLFIRSKCLESKIDSTQSLSAMEAKCFRYKIRSYLKDKYIFKINNPQDE